MIPFIVMCICFYIAHFIFDATTVFSDSAAQLVPFLSEYKYKILNHESIWFSNNGALGCDFYFTG